MIPLSSLASLLMLAAPPVPVIMMNQDHLHAVTGQTLMVESEINAPAGSIAHLNVTSLDGVYVDLEDWTKDVTQPVPVESPVQLDWEFQAVNSGQFALYVVVIPKSGPLIVSPPVHVTVSSRQSLETGGALPVALAIPGLLGVATLGTRLRRRAKSPS